jgi:hypothetical protein
MTRRLSSSLSALVIGGLIAGCGSSSTSSHSVSPATGASGVTPAASVRQAVGLCRGIISLAPYLSASDKAKFEGVCTKGASGSTEQARDAFREVCIEVIERTGFPRVQKEQLLAGCKARAGH